MRRGVLIIGMVLLIGFVSVLDIAMAQEQQNETSSNTAMAQEQQNETSSNTAMAQEQQKQTQSMVVLACAIAMGIAGIGSAIGLGIGGTSAAAVTAEKPELFAKSLILQMLPMTQTIYAFITSILLLMGAGLLGAAGKMDLSSSAVGMSAVFIGLLVGLTGLSAINQGIISSAGIAATGRNPSVAGRGIIFAVMPETVAIFGFLVGLLIMILGLKILG